MDAIWFIGGLIALAILLFVIGIARSIEAPAADRLEDYLGEKSLQARSSAAQAGGLSSSAGDLVQGFDRALRSVSAVDRLAQMLRRADLQFTATEFLAFWLILIVVAFALGYVLSQHWLPAILTSLLGVVLPYFFLQTRRSGRLRAFNNQLNGVLMQLSGSLRAGYGMQQAIEFVSHEMPPPAGKEFTQVLRDVRLGRALMDALADMLDRVESDDLRLVITAIRIHHEIGGNLAEILENVSETIRERVRIKGELRALTAQQRMAGYVLSVLPVVVFLCLMVLNPTYEIRLFAPGPTLCIPFGAMIFMIIGLLTIRRIVALEV